MQDARRNLVIVIFCVISVGLLSGCTDWKKKYNALNVEHQNLKGLLDRERGEKSALASQVTHGQQTIDELQRQLQDMQKSGDTGFGEGYNVSVDPSAGTVTVTLDNAILFAPGKVELKSVTSKELDHILSVLNSKYAGKAIDVVGHTDSDPIKKSKWADNWQLSTERSLSVVRYLIDRGIGEGQIRAVGRGPSLPVASNSTADGKAKNRRVEIVVNMRG